MRNSIIGLIVGVIFGIVVGATVIAPRLQRTAPTDTAQPPVQQPTELAKQLPRALVARPEVAFKVASAYPLDSPLAGALARRIDERTWQVSHGQIELRLYPPGALTPATDIFEAVAAGAIDAAFASPAAGGDVVPALKLFSGIPFGPPADEFLAWLEVGGGRSLLDELEARRNVHGISCGLLPAASFGWFRQEILSPQDLRGLRMSIGGLGARVLERMGVIVTPLQPGDLMLALEHGTIDAVSFTSPAADVQMPVATWLKNYYPQGWSLSPGLAELLVDPKGWRELSSTQQAQIEAVCGDNMRFALAENEARQYPALKEMFASGVRLQRLPPPVVEALERAWAQVAQQLAHDDPDFRRIWQSLTTFRSEFAVWRELSR